jgi:DMSO/TMAO reductase YedYZ molybdopterin-dependent catalytic subunit
MVDYSSEGEHNTLVSEPKLEKIVEARMRLRARFEDKMRETPAASDTRPQGSGPTNRHGMPQLPVGQTETKKWPVLDLGVQPQIAIDAWRLIVDGACDAPVTLAWADFMALEQVEDVSDFHCVTTWSRMDVPWVGVRVADVLALAQPHPGATHVMCHAFDGYSTNVALEEALKPDVLLVHRADGAPLPVAHGGPVRMITPQLYAWKGAKWISRLELLARDRPGFWEQRGYSMTAHPWRNDRYG